jgi:hypothetical protein
MGLAGHHEQAGMIQDLAMTQELKSKAYLEYFDKEMTIMGILSAFGVGLAALALERTAAAENGTPLAEVWRNSNDCIAAGSAAALLAGLFFYLQRSRLAWYYGQIVLHEINEPSDQPGLKRWLAEADAWDTWFRYQTGFILLSLSVIFLGFAGARAIVPSLQSVCSMPLLAGLGSVCLFIVLVLRRQLIVHRYCDVHPFSPPWRHRPCLARNAG